MQSIDSTETDEIRKVLGASLIVLEHLERSNPNDFPPLHSYFFKPYQSAYDACVAASSIFIAPLVYEMVALSHLVDAIVVTTRCLYNLARFTPNNEKNVASNMAIKLLIKTVLISLFAIASPIINLVDVIGSVLTTLKQTRKTHSLHENSCHSPAL